jgi:hypothetical protein
MKRSKQDGVCGELVQGDLFGHGVLKGPPSTDEPLAAILGSGVSYQSPNPLSADGAASWVDLRIRSLGSEVAGSLGFQVFRSGG